MTILKKYKKLSDEHLVELLQKGDTSAFNELYKRYSTRLLYYFFRMFGGREEKAQDFLQETFLKIVQKPQLINPEKRFASWIFTVAHNLCKNEYRRQFRIEYKNDEELETQSSHMSDSMQNLEENVDVKLFEHAVLVELNKLGTNHKSTFLLRYQEHLSIKEISTILKCSQGTVKSRLFYTNQKLATRLKDYNPHNIEV